MPRMQQGVVRTALCAAACLALAGACTGGVRPRWDPASGAPRPARVKLRVEGEGQRRSLSCESRSAVDLLAHYGIAVAEDEFRRGLPLSDNPDLGFVGDVDGPGEQLPPDGYGVHAEPVAARIADFGLPVHAGRNRDLEWLRRQIARGRPVIVWATGQMDAPRPVAMRDAAGRAFTAVRGEHTWLAIGYGPGTITLIDATTGREREFAVSRFDAAWATLGRQALVPEESPPPR